MSNWPLHITLVNTFAVERSLVSFDEKLQDLLKKEPVFEATAGRESVLGMTKVMLIEKTEQIMSLNNKIIELIESNSGILNNPEFNREGYIPHSTIQNDDQLDIGEQIQISHLSLVDMFPDGDWQRRRILVTFELG